MGGQGEQEKHFFIKKETSWALSATQRTQTPWSRSDRRRRHKMWLHAAVAHVRAQEIPTDIPTEPAVRLQRNCICTYKYSLVSSQKVNGRRQGCIFGGDGNFGQPLQIFETLDYFISSGIVFLQVATFIYSQHMFCVAACMFFTLSTSLFT